MEGVFVVIVACVLIAVALRMTAGAMDHARVERYIAERGGRVIRKQWSPFGRGWFGEKDSRIYEVEYEDAEGNVHQATCKTSFLSGVYFTEDRILKPPLGQRRATEESELVEENRRLRQELDELRRAKDSPP